MAPAICFSVSFFVIGSLVCFSRPQHLCSSCEPAVFCVECVFYIVNMKKAKSIFHHFFYCRKILYSKLFACLCRISLQLFCIARDFQLLTSSNLCVFLRVISSCSEAVVLTLLVLKCTLKIKWLDLTEAEVEVENRSNRWHQARGAGFDDELKPKE